MSDKPKLATVRTAYVSNARQVPVMMRKLAEECENPPVPGVTIDQSVCIIRDSRTGQIQIYAWGDLDIDDSLSMLAQSMSRLTSIADKGDLWRMGTTGVKPENPDV